jgi:hypothetical protein
MQDRFYLFRRQGVFYWQDRTTGQQKSLQTRDKLEARRQLQAKNDSVAQPMMNLILARTYLSAQDPKMTTRTWAEVMTQFCNRGKEATRRRNDRETKTKPMLFLRNKRLIETTADDLLHAMSIGTNSVHLHTLHNDALGMGWIPGPILPRKRWPRVVKKVRRAVGQVVSGRINRTHAKHANRVGVWIFAWFAWLRLNGAARE